MKRILYILAGLFLIAACEKEPIEQKEGNNYTLDEVVKCNAVEDDINSFLFDMTLKGQGYTISMSFKNHIEALPEGEYKVSNDLSAERNCTLTLNDGKSDKNITHGKVKFAANNGLYTINVDLVVGAGAKYSFVYEGPINLDTDINPYKDVTLTKVVRSVASPYEDGSFRLDLVLSDDTYDVSVSLNYPEAVLPTGEYTASADLNSMSNCILSLNDGQTDHQILHGGIKITADNGRYIINIDAVANVTAKYALTYEGEVTFDIDFTPSTYSVLAIEANITTWNQNWQEEIIQGVSKYTILVLDSKDNTVASLELVSEPGKTISELVGEYNIGTDNVPGTLKAGANSWGSISGSYFYDNNTQTFITKGKVSITKMTDNDGIVYYSISGNELTSKNGSLDIKYVKEDQFHGTVIRNNVISSKKMNKSMKYSIYLPAGYEEGDTYPILYLLHGYGDENNAWLDKGNLMLTARSYEKNGGNPMIVVCPDGLTDFYVGRWENYMYEELMPEIENNYKFSGKRAVAGLSMGGYGSIYYWSKYPEMYCYAYAMSPAVDVNGTSQILAGKDKNSLPKLTIETGIQDQTTSLTSITELHDYLVTEGIEHEFITRDGSHDWTFWQVCLPKALAKCGESFE